MRYLSQKTAIMNDPKHELDAGNHFDLPVSRRAQLLMLLVSMICIASEFIRHPRNDQLLEQIRQVFEK